MLLSNVAKPCALLCVRSQILQKHVFYCVFLVLGSKNLVKPIKKFVFWSESCMFSENPWAKMQKTQKSEKAIMSYMKNCKIEAFLVRILEWKRFFAPDTSRHQDFPDFSILRYVWVFCVGFGTFSVIFLHFLHKYRCVPKIGFSADSFIVYSIDISIGISIDILLTFLSTFLLAF